MYNTPATAPFVSSKTARAPRTEAPSWESVSQGGPLAGWSTKGGPAKGRSQRPPSRHAVLLDPTARPDHLGDSLTPPSGAPSLG